MATHSSTLAWKIPWTKEPGRLQSMGSRRVGYDWVTSLSLFTFMHWRRKWQPTPVFLPGESQGRGSLVGCRLWGCTESDTTEATADNVKMHVLLLDRTALWTHLIPPFVVSMALSTFFFSFHLSLNPLRYSCIVEQLFLYPHFMVSMLKVASYSKMATRALAITAVFLAVRRLKECFYQAKQLLLKSQFQKSHIIYLLIPH